MATPGTEACDAVGGALRPKWREWPSRAIRRVLSERVAFGILPAALFALLRSCPSSGRKHCVSPGHITVRPWCVQVGFGFPAPLWNSGRERDGRIQHAQQEQTLVILLQTILSHLAHDEIPNLR